jgi:hypothetical protein
MSNKEVKYFKKQKHAEKSPEKVSKHTEIVREEI